MVRIHYKKGAATVCHVADNRRKVIESKKFTLLLRKVPAWLRVQPLLLC